MPSLILILSLILNLNVYAVAELTLQERVQTAYDTVREDSPSEKDALTAEERELLLNRTSNNPVAALSQLHKYDNQKIGFCFGRAMTAHLIARKMGLKEDSIRKLFVLGDLRSGPDPEWRFHVTTVVKGSEDGGWYAIDPIMRPPLIAASALPAATWIETVQGRWDKNKAAKFYLAGPQAIMPDMRIVPTKPHLESGHRVVELTFDPLAHAGFEALTIGTHAAYSTDALAEEKYFIRADETVPGETFDFDHFLMHIIRPTEEIDLDLKYNGYFVDLLTDLEGPLHPPLSLQNAKILTFSAEGRGLESSEPDLHSLRIR
jgi:hypothetical protein